LTKSPSTDISKINKQVYESKYRVERFVAKSELQRPEITILEILKDELPNYSMLDIGVGRGRTTKYFATKVKEYVGIDYSPPMIQLCQRNYEFDFRVCDARDMHIFPDSKFDFVLFSFNGMDYMVHEDRIKTLKEIKRVMVKGGSFCFSSHNLNYVPKLLALKMTFYPSEFIYTIRKRVANRVLFKRSNFSRFAFINDGVLGFRLLTYYIEPMEQVSQLQTLGFHDIKTFGQEGTLIKDSDLPKREDPWIYYLCQG
jgi:ubiquinone/menaquinone biosynthesis C-methylase UbiE